MPESTSRHDTSRPQVPDDVKQHLRAARVEMRKGLETVLPPEFFSHRDAARREMLLAWRGAIDVAVRRMDDAAQRRDATR